MVHNGTFQGRRSLLTAEDEATDDDSLKALFEPFGNITSVVAMKETSLRHVQFGQCLMPRVL